MIELLYENDYTTLEKVRDQLRGTSSDDLGVTANPTLTLLIHAASVLFSRWCERVFVPYQQTRSYTVYECGYESLEFDEPLLSLTTLTDFNGSAVSSSNYRLFPLNSYPKESLVRIDDAQFTYSTRHDLLTVAGHWGYHQNYPNAWLAATTLNDASVTDSVTTITVTSATNIDTLDYLQIDSEWLQVTAIDTNTLTVTRAVNGTTAAAHTNGATVSVYQQTPGVEAAVRYLVIWLYMNRSAAGGVVQMSDGSLILEQAPKVVRDAVDLYRVPLAWESTSNGH